MSSLKMAEYFAEAGWKDITVAFPVNILEIERIRRLAAAIQLNLLAESLDTINYLEKNLRSSVNLFLKIDIGYQRTGIHPDKQEKIQNLLNRIDTCNYLQFAGFIGHAGHSYKARSKQEIADIHTSSIEVLKELKKEYQGKFPGMIISIGDTPTCSVMDNFSGIDEIRPGNFVFYDLTQHTIGSCRLSDIAVAMACPIVAKHADRNELIVYGGGVHFSKEKLTRDTGDQTLSGIVVHLDETGWKFTDGRENYVSKLSQEHGTLKVDQQVFDHYKIGDLIGVLPVHSCMTANLMKSYRTLEGELISRL